ncbi:hypothetical protein [Collinsella intestinalis]|uniref:hypothetical protein n=1 Tax=Collinsella intestinalis TaxID=147207 RepID=UPI001959E739|nr:hypothetical protein [Collinsella intestinalis]
MVLPVWNAFRLDSRTMHWEGHRNEKGGSEITSHAIEAKLARLQRGFKVIVRLLWPICIFISVLMVIPSLLMVVGCFVPFFPCSVQGDFSAALLDLLFLPLSVCIPWTLLYFARKISEGHSPFNSQSPRYMLMLALAYFCMAVSNFFSSGKASITIDIFGWTFGISLGSEPGFLDIGSLCACLVFVCLALVFKYGQMLQAVSDDTV